MPSLAWRISESNLLLGMFRVDSKKFKKISENIEIKGVIVSPML